MTEEIELSDMALAILKGISEEYLSSEEVSKLLFNSVFITIQQKDKFDRAITELVNYGFIEEAASDDKN